MAWDETAVFMNLAYFFLFKVEIFSPFKYRVKVPLFVNLMLHVIS